jgi:hypothetical protein
MHLEAADQSADSADDGTAYHADRGEALDQRLYSYPSYERLHAPKSCGFACKWPAQPSAQCKSGAVGDVMLVWQESASGCPDLGPMPSRALSRWAGAGPSRVHQGRRAAKREVRMGCTHQIVSA